MTGLGRRVGLPYALYACHGTIYTSCCDEALLKDLHVFWIVRVPRERLYGSVL